MIHNDSGGLLKYSLSFLRYCSLVFCKEIQEDEVVQNHKENYDVIISDYQMTGIDGIQFLTQIRKKFRKIPFILFTGKGREEVVIQAINSGADFYLQKGIETKSQFAELAQMIREATSRKRAEQALRENEEQFRILSEQSILGIGIIQDGIFQYFNEGYCAISGYSEDEIHSWNRFEYAKTVHPEDLDFVMEQIQKKETNSPGAVTHYSFRALNKEGEVIFLDLYSKTIMYHGRYADFVTFIDITERKQAEEAIRQTNQKLTLLSSVTRHDIKNQLMVQDGYLNILEEMLPELTHNDDFLKVKTVKDHIFNLIQFTKEYEQIGINVPSWQDCRTLISIAANQANFEQITIKNDLPAGFELFADPLIVKVFYNLIDNALRYGEIITNIRFSVQERDGSYIILCEDDGIGIQAEDKSEIFERGFGKNSGLGLTLAKDILDISGITILENGEPQKGARFEIVVPIGKWRFERDVR